MPRRSHDDCDAVPFDANLERLLGWRADPGVRRHHRRCNAARDRFGSRRSSSLFAEWRQVTHVAVAAGELICRSRANRARVRLVHGAAALDAHDRVVIRHAAGLIDDAALDDDVPLRPVNLQIAGRDRREENAPFEPPDIIHERDAIPGAHVQPAGIVFVHQHGVARGAVERIDLGIDERVELLPASRADVETAGRTLQLREVDRAEMPFAVSASGTCRLRTKCRPPY